jgi:nucleobase:cation symporter-1, NCS1 family
MEAVRHVQGWSGAVIWAIMIFLAIYLLVRSGGHLSLTNGGTHLAGRSQVYYVFASMGLLMGILGTLMLNYADFTRFAPHRSAILRGSFWGVPVNWVLFALTSVIVSAGTLAVYGHSILNPGDIFAHLSNDALLLVGALLLVLAAVGVNIVANFVSPAFDLANVWPGRISFARGGIITAVVALASLPWKMYTTPVVINYFLGGLGALIGPLYGVMIVDYFVVRRRRVSIPDLYIADARSRYFYRGGVNPRAVAAFLPAAVLAVAVAVVPALSVAAPFAWFVGAGAAALIYHLLARGQRATAGSATPAPAAGLNSAVETAT